MNEANQTNTTANNTAAPEAVPAKSGWFGETAMTAIKVVGAIAVVAAAVAGTMYVMSGTSASDIAPTE